MKFNTKYFKVIYITGIVALLAGALDPLEGSVLIAIGSILIALAGHFLRVRHHRIYFVNMILILTGVFSLFYLSTLGGFGGKSGLSWWWALLILPYPVGWISDLILLILSAFRIEANKS